MDNVEPVWTTCVKSFSIKMFGNDASAVICKAVTSVSKFRLRKLLMIGVSNWSME
jgi:hypothetical protein